MTLPTSRLTPFVSAPFSSFLFFLFFSDLANISPNTVRECPFLFFYFFLSDLAGISPNTVRESLSLSLSRSLSPSLTLAHSLTLTLSLSHSIAHTLSHSLAFSFSPQKKKGIVAHPQKEWLPPLPSIRDVRGWGGGVEVGGASERARECGEGGMEVI